jgi:signal transduction histidine kinase
LAFKFAARALLELGKELISSDEVAINELVKNAVDAESPSIQLSLQVLVTHRVYEDALHRLSKRAAPQNVLDRLESQFVANVSEELKAAFLAPLRLLTNDRAAFTEELHKLYRDFNWIEVRDQGHGMSSEDLDQVYLTVGTRSRRKANMQGAAYLGDKGVGRLSAMRLGNHLHINTSRNGERRWNVLNIDWLQFGHDVETDVGSIAVAPEPGELKADRTLHGTTVRISALLADWSEPRVDELLAGPIARMIDPFKRTQDASKASETRTTLHELLRVDFNGRPKIIPKIPPALLRDAHATCRVSLRFEGKDETPVLEGMIEYRLRNAKRVVHQVGTEIYSLTQQEIPVRGKKGHVATMTTPIRPEVLKSLGPIEVEVYWFNRLIVQAIPSLTQGTLESRKQIARWAGGPMLYRHGFRVLPYGNPDDDWLGLDKNAFGSAGFKLNRQQVIGRVVVNAAHTALSEQTNREGLVESPETAVLQALLVWVLDTEMRDLINEADKNEQLNLKRSKASTEDFRQTETKVLNTLAELRVSSPATSRVYIDQLEKRVAKLSDQCSDIVTGVEKNAKQIADDREQFVHLAGIGLMTEFIFHELDRSVAFAVKELQSVRKAMPTNAVLKSLDEQLSTLHKRISAFDALSGEKRQVKVRFDVGEVASVVMDGHSNAFKRHDIEFSIRQDKPLVVRGVKGMLIQILENLVANSEYWLKQQSGLEPGFIPRIHVEISAATRTLSVTDNGPGVAPDRAEVIFHPFVSSKPAKHGRGLGLYISRELATYHGWKIAMDENATAIRQDRLNTFQIDFSEETK